jgi:hypothetical protein
MLDILVGFRAVMVHTTQHLPFSNQQLLVTTSDLLLIRSTQLNYCGIIFYICVAVVLVILVDRMYLSSLTPYDEAHLFTFQVNLPRISQYVRSVHKVPKYILIRLRVASAS